MNDQYSKSDELPPENAFAILSDEHRRIVLTHLLTEDGPVSVDELVERIVSEFHLVEGNRLNDIRQLIAVRLYHVHLPLMDSIGIVEYDSERDHVETTDKVWTIEPYLEIDRPSDSR